MEEVVMTVPTPEPAPEAPEPTPAPPDLGDAGKKALEQERDARKSAENTAKALQAKLSKLEQAQMSDLERAQTLATEAAEDAKTARAEALRWRIAAKHGISDADAETFLTGSDEATLSKQAERLAAINKTATATSPAPRADLSQGGKATTAPGSPAQDFATFLQSQMT